MCQFGLEVERTSKNRTSNISNLRGLNFEHIQTFGPEPNFEPLEHHQKPNCSWTLLIKNGPNCFKNLQNRTSNMSEHLILAKNRTSNLPNITKNQTVREHRTVRSTSSLAELIHTVLANNTSLAELCTILHSSN